MSLLPSSHSEIDSPGGRRSAIYLPDCLAAKLLSVCDVTAGIESSEPSSPIHHHLDDLWTEILASAGSVDSLEAEKAIRRFGEQYGLVPCLPGSNTNRLNRAETLETPSEDLYKGLLEAAFGNPSSGTFQNEDQDTAPKTGVSLLCVSSSLYTWAPTREGFASLLCRAPLDFGSWTWD